MMKTYNTLDELLTGEAVETPHHLGRTLYKYTDCGPWTAFVVRGAPTRTETDLGEVRVDPKTGKLHCTRGSEETRQFLGFGPNGKAEENWTSLNAYFKRVQEFQKKHCGDSGERFRIESAQKCIGCVRVRLSRTTPETTTTVYYEDEKAYTMLGDCVGVKLGSIVEGSDVEIGPVTLMFPFTDDDLHRAVGAINDEANFYWDRDNSIWFEVRAQKRDYFVRCFWGDITWQGKKPAKALRQKVEQLLQSEKASEIPQLPGMWQPAQKDWSPMPIPGTDATIHEFINDTTY